MISPAAIRAARGWLNWTQQELATTSGVGIAAIRNYERGTSQMVYPSMVAIARTLADAGITIVAQEGEPVGITWREKVVSHEQ